MLHDDAFIVRNASLTESITHNRKELLAFYQAVKNEIRKNRRSFKYGISFTPRSIFLRPKINRHIEAIISRFRECLHRYEITAVELWLGGGGREGVTLAHNDAIIYIQSGENTHMQFWVLLEACMMDNDNTAVERNKGALECLVPTAPGPFFPSMDINALWTPAGSVAYREKGVVGGDDLAIGDVLVFKNGVLHRSDGGAEGVFRAALCFRAELKDETKDQNYALWFRDALRRNSEASALLAPNPYFQYLKKTLLDSLPDVPCDPHRLDKKDRNDPWWLKTQIKNCAFIF